MRRECPAAPEGSLATTSEAYHRSHFGRRQTTEWAAEQQDTAGGAQRRAPPLILALAGKQA